MGHMKRIHLFLSQPQWVALVALAKARGLSFSEMVRRVIDEYLREHGP
jgi:hypothetical protein